MDIDKNIRIELETTEKKDKMVKMNSIIIAVAAFYKIFVDGGMYGRDSEIPDGTITKYMKGKTKINCLLQCELLEECDTIMFKLKNQQMRSGECWFVKKKSTDEKEKRKMQELNEDKLIKIFKKLPVCETSNPCSLGSCTNTDDSKGYTCKSAFAKSWIPIERNVCFGTKANEFGRFVIPYDGIIVGMKLSHVGGSGVKCFGNSQRTNWGCTGVAYYAGENIGIVITDDRENVLYPSMMYFVAHGYFLIPGYHANSPNLVFNKTQHAIHKGQELRLYYSELLYNGTLHNNEGDSCADIYVMMQ